MLNKYFKILSVLTVSLTGFSLVFGQVSENPVKDARRTLTLGRCIQYGLDTNYDLKALFSKISVRQQERWALQTQNLPTVSIDVVSDTFLDVTQNYVDTNQAILRIQQMIYDGGKVKHSVHRAMDETDIAVFEYEIGKQNLIFLIKRAYTEAQRNFEKMRVARNKIGRWRHLYRNLEKRIETGSATVIEAKRAKNNLMRMRKEYTEFTKAHSQWRSTIATLTTIDARKIDGLAPLTEDDVDLKPLESYIQLAISRRKEIAQQRSRIDSKYESIRVEQARNLPELRVSGGPGFVGIGNDYDLKFEPTVDIRFTLFYDIYTWGRTKSMITAAQIEHAIAQIELDKTMLVVMSEIIDTYEQVEQSRRLLIANRNYVATAKSATRDASALFVEGKYTVRDLIDVEREDEEAELSYIDSTAEMNIAKARLYRAISYDDALIQ